MASNSKGAGLNNRFLYLHCEKIACGLVGMLALIIVYKSFELPRLDDEYQADSLQREINMAHNEIAGFTWAEAVSNHPDRVCTAKIVAAKGNFKVEVQGYVNSGDPNGKMLVGFDTPIVAPMIARADPPVLNAVDVYATGGTGMFAFSDEEIRKQRQLRMATEAQELARKEEEKAKMELYSQQTGDAAGFRGRSGRWGRPGAEPSNQPYDPDHPKRRLIDTSLPIRGISLQGDERIERAYWACVVAKVPIRDQLKLYQDSFEKARGYDAGRDFPQYLGFFVERAEDLAGKELYWQRVALYDGQQKSIAANSPLSNGPHHAISISVVNKLYAAAGQFWAGGGPAEVVDDRFIERVLTLPLPPLVGRDWGSEVTHPDIRLNLPPLEEDADQLLTSTTEPQPSTMVSEFGSWNATMPAGPRGFTRSGGYAQRNMRPGGMNPEGYGPGSRRFAGGPGEIRASYRSGVGVSRTAVPHTALPVGVDYYLLRFFDYTVQPGKKYKYRVKLVVADPNYDMPANTLLPAVLDRQAQSAKANKGRKPIFRMAEAWSAPSPTVEIPIGGRILLADVKTPSGGKFNDEPSASLVIEAFALDEKGNAIQAGIEEKNFRRGDVVNLVEDAEYIGPGYIDTQQNFRFFTGMTLLDIDGGTKLTGDTTVPARILLMGPAGQLYIRNETDDKPFVDYHRLLFEKRNQNNSRAGRRIARRPA